MFRIDNPNHKHVWGVQTLLLGNNLQDSLGSWRSIPSSRVITQCLVLILGIVPVSLTDLTDAEYIYRRVTCTLGHRSSTRSMCLTNLCFIASFKYMTSTVAGLLGVQQSVLGFYIWVLGTILLYSTHSVQCWTMTCIHLRTSKGTLGPAPSR